MIDQKSGIEPRAMMISVVATEAVMNPNPKTPSATILRCCIQESNSRHPATAGVNTAMANNVVRLGTPCEQPVTRQRSVNPIRKSASISLWGQSPRLAHLPLELLYDSPLRMARAFDKSHSPEHVR